MTKQVALSPNCPILMNCVISIPCSTSSGSAAHQICNTILVMFQNHFKFFLENISASLYFLFLFLSHTLTFSRVILLFQMLTLGLINAAINRGTKLANPPSYFIILFFYLFLLYSILRAIQIHFRLLKSSGTNIMK